METVAKAAESVVADSSHAVTVDSSNKTDESVQTNISKVKDSTLPTSEKPTKNKLKPLHFWNVADCSKWLKKHNSNLHSIYNELFELQDITGRTLIRVNDIKLEQIGVTNAEHRKELMQNILKLRLRHEATDLKDLDQKGIGFELKKTTEKMKQQASKDKENEKKDK